jgi:ABC-type glycerol-3-phosphate transport system substrate-binding protein
MKLEALALTSIVVVASAAACSSSGDGNGANSGAGGAAGHSGATSQSVKIASWWKAPGEAEAIDGLIKTFKAQNTGYSVTFDLIVDGVTAQSQLNAELADPVSKPPPDVAQYNANNVPGCGYRRRPHLLDSAEHPSRELIFLQCGRVERERHYTTHDGG